MPSNTECPKWSQLRTEATSGSIAWLTSDPGTTTLPSTRVNTAGEFWTYFQTNASDPYTTNRVMTWQQMLTYKQTHKSAYASRSTQSTNAAWTGTMTGFSAPFTIEFWLRARDTTISTEQGICCHWDNGDGTYYAGWSLNINTGGQFVIHWGKTGPSIATTTFTTTFAPNTWQHVAVVFSSSTPSIYINGSLSQTAGSIANHLGNFGTQNFLAGAGIDTGANVTCGDVDLDEMRYWNIARSATDISSNYQTTLAPTTTGIVAYYRFENNANDSSTNAYNLSAYSASPNFITDTPI